MVWLAHVGAGVVVGATVVVVVVVDVVSPLEVVVEVVLPDEVCDKAQPARANRTSSIMIQLLFFE